MVYILAAAITYFIAKKFILKDSKPAKYEGKPNRFSSRKVCIAWNTLHPDDPVDVPDENED